MDIAFVIIITSGIILAQDFLFVNIEVKISKSIFKWLEFLFILMFTYYVSMIVLALGLSHPIQWLCRWIGLLPLASKAGYKESRAKLHKKMRAADSAALVVYFSFFFPLGPRGLDSGRIFQPLAK